LKNCAKTLFFQKKLKQRETQLKKIKQNVFIKNLKRKRWKFICDIGKEVQSIIFVIKFCIRCVEFKEDKRLDVNIR
jgi:hypothetical protein